MTFAQRLHAIGMMFWGKALQFCKLGIIGNCKAMITMTVSMIGGLIPAVISGAVAVGTFAAALWATGIPAIILAISALVGVVILVYRNFDRLNSILPGLGDYLLLILGPIGWIAAIIKNWNHLPGIFTRMSGGIKILYTWIADKLCAAFRWVSNLLDSFWNTFKKVCPNLANLIEKLFAIFWAGIRGSYNFWVSVFQKIYHFTAGILKAIGSFFVGLWDGVMDGIRAFYDAFSDILLSMYQWFDSIFGGFFSGVGGIIREVIGAITSADQWLGSMLSKLSKIPGFGFLDPNATAENPPAAGIRIPEGREIRDAEKITRMANPPAIIENTVVNRSTDYSGDTVNQKSSLFSSVIAVRTERDVPAGGVRSNTKNNYFGSVTITAPNGMGPGELEEWALLQG